MIRSIKKTGDQDKEFQECRTKGWGQQGEDCSIKLGVQVDLIEKVRFEERCEESNRVSQVAIWGKGIPCKRNSCS